MKLIRVLHAVSVDKENYYLRNLAKFSDPERVKYSFLTLADDGCDFVKDMRSSGMTANGLGLIGKMNLPRAYREIKRILAADQPDVVHVHLFEPSLVALRAAKTLGIATVLTRHHSDALHNIGSPMKRRFYLSLENYISRNSGHIIAPSKTVREFLLKEGVPAEKISVVPYGQTTERFDAVTPEQIEQVRQELNMGPGPNLVNVSRLFHRKGHSDLFEAFARLDSERGDSLTLYLVGDGDYRGELEARCHQLGIQDKVRFLGWRNDALTIMAAADLIVHPSLEDALSSAVIEALMLEKPIVATDISGVRDTLGDGKYGHIVPPADADSLRKAVEETIKNMSKAQESAVAGRKYLLDYMDAARVSRAYEEIYSRLI